MCRQALPEWKQGVATNLAEVGQWLRCKPCRGRAEA